MLPSNRSADTRAYRSTKRSRRPGTRGRWSTSAASRSPMEISLFDPLIREIKIISSNCYGIIDGVHDYEVAINLLASGEYPYRDAVKHRYGLEDVGEAFDTAFDKTTGRGEGAHRSGMNRRRLLSLPGCLQYSAP